MLDRFAAESNNDANRWRKRRNRLPGTADPVCVTDASVWLPMSQPPPPNEVNPAPRALRPVRRSARRRALLIGALFAIIAATIGAVFALDALNLSLNRGTQLAQSMTGAELPDCSGPYPDWIAAWVEDELGAIRAEYGQGEDSVVTAWMTPEEFPAAAFGWAGVVPDCGSMMLVRSTGDLWAARLDVATVDKAQFTAVATTLAALGYVLTYDQVPHEFLAIEGEPVDVAEDAEEQSGQQTGASWFREFSSETGRVSLTFFPDDPEATNPAGELVIVFLPPID